MSRFATTAYDSPRQPTANNTTTVHVHRNRPQPLRAAGLHDVTATATPYGPRPAAPRGPATSTAPERPARAGAMARRLGQAAAQLPRSHKGPPLPRSAKVRLGGYDGAELGPHTDRPGAMDAYALPSRVGRHLFYRDGRVESLA